MADEPGTEATSPPLEEVLQQAIRGALAGVHVGFAATVVSYDQGTQTVCVQPVVRGRLRDEDGVVTTYRLPQLVGVPVEFPAAWSPSSTGLPCSITWPLAPGSEGMVRIAERSHDEQRATGNRDTTPQHPRRFDLSDATFYPCVTSKPAKLPASAVDAVAVVVCSPAPAGAPTLKLGSSSAAQAFVLGTAFASLYNAHTHATPAGPSGPPVVLMDTVPGTHLSQKIAGE